MSDPQVVIPAGIITQDFSVLVGTTPIWIFRPGQLQYGLRWMRIINCSSFGSFTTSMNGFVFLSRNGSPATMGAPGSFMLIPGDREEFRGDFIPLNGLSAIANQAGVPLTIEIG